MIFNTLNIIEYDFIKNLLTRLSPLSIYPLLENLAIFVSFLGNNGAIWIGLMLALLLFPKTRTIGIGLALSLIISFVGGELLLKNIIMRIRPFMLYGDSIPIPHPSGYSFPSGHTMSSFSAATCLFLYHKKLGIPCFILAALIGLSRIFLQVHYPTDVLAGIVLGALSGFIGFSISHKLPMKSKSL